MGIEGGDAVSERDTDWVHHAGSKQYGITIHPHYTGVSKGRRHGTYLKCRRGASGVNQDRTLTQESSF